MINFQGYSNFSKRTVLHSFSPSDYKVQNEYSKDPFFPNLKRPSPVIALVGGAKNKAKKQNIVIFILPLPTATPYHLCEQPQFRI